MKPVVHLSLLLLVATAMFTSCKKATPKQTKFIPKEAAVVTTINTRALHDKLMSNQETLENLVKTMSEGNDTAMDKGKKEWEDFKNSGVDLTENIYIAVVNKGGGSMVPGAGTSMISVVGGLKDAGKLEAYVKKKHAKAEIKKEKDYTYAMNDDNMIAWGKDVVVALTAQKQPPMMEYDSTTGSYSPMQGQSNSSPDLVAEMTRYFNLKDDETVGAIAEFRDLIKEKADASFWVNSASNFENLPIPLPKVKELFENSFTAATMNFEDGKMVFNSKSYSSKAMADLLKKYTGPTANLGLVENYPSGNINGFAVFSINPELINGMVQYMEVGAMVNGYLSKMMGSNYTVQEALKAIKGDMAFVVSDMAIAKSDATQMGMRPSTRPTAKVLLNIPVGDKAQLDRLLAQLVEKQMLVKQNNEYKLAPQLSVMGFQLSIDDKNILVSSDSVVLSQYKAKSGKATLDNNVMNDFKDKSAVAYVDLQKIMNSYQPGAEDTSVQKVLASAKGTFKDMKGYAENFNGKYIEGRFEVRFMNEKENSLTSLLKFATIAAQNAKKMDRQGKWDPSMDDKDVQIDSVQPEPRKK